MVTKDATCTEAGEKTETCTVCGEETIVEIPATGHLDTDEVIDKAATCISAGQKTVTCNDCGDVSVVEIPKLTHNIENGKCTNCGGEAAWVLKDIADILPTDVVVVAMTNSSGTYALYNANGTSKAPTATAVTVVGNALSGTIDSAVMWNVVKDADGNFIFYVNGTTDTWLYATNTNNGVRVGDNDENAAFKIDETSGYLFNIATSRYIGIYNSADWRCYTSINTNIKDQTLGFYVLTVEEPTPEFVGAQVNVAADLAIKYHTYIPEGYDVNDFTLRITTAHGRELEISTYTTDNGNYVFTYAGIAPQCMSDNIKAELLYNGEVVDTVADYSIVQNAKNLAARADATDALKVFLADLLAYGQAAQEYINHDVAISEITDADIAAIGAAGTAAPDASINDTHRVLGDRTAPQNAYISGAGVRFDNQVQIYVSVKGDNAADAKIKVGGVEYDVASVGGKYVVYLPGLSITEISEPLAIELYYDGECVHTITYGAYAYVYQMIAKDSNANIAKLAQALYNCAESAKAYVG